MTDKERFELIVKIAKRADEKGLMGKDRFTLITDLEYADKQFNLRLDELLHADGFNFAHDIVGIQNHINRETGEIENIFLPRYSS